MAGGLPDGHSGRGRPFHVAWSWKRQPRGEIVAGVSASGGLTWSWWHRGTIGSHFGKWQGPELASVQGRAGGLRPLGACSLSAPGGGSSRPRECQCHELGVHLTPPDARPVDAFY